MDMHAVVGRVLFPVSRARVSARLRIPLLVPLPVIQRVAAGNPTADDLEAEPR